MLGIIITGFIIKGAIVNWLRLITVQVVLFSAVSCFAAEPNAQKREGKNNCFA